MCRRFEGLPSSRELKRGPGKGTRTRRVVCGLLPQAALRKSSDQSAPLIFLCVCYHHYHDESRLAFSDFKLLNPLIPAALTPSSLREFAVGAASMAGLLEIFSDECLV